MHKSQKIILFITIALTILVWFTAISAILMEDGGAPHVYTTLRGEEVDIYGGKGIYAYNTVNIKKHRS